MKIFTLHFFLLFFFLQTTSAQNNTVYIDCPGWVGGTWSADNLYIARCNVLVPYDSVLTIESGVRIEFQEGFSFTVEGQLQAIGAGNNRIEMAPFGEGSWKGITFTTPSGKNMRTSSLSFVDIDCGSTSYDHEAVVIGKHEINSVNNLRIKNAEKAIRITGFATIDNITYCNFEDVKKGIVFQYCDSVSHVNIQNCIFNRISERAVIIANNEALLGQVNISGNVFNNAALSNNISESAVYITLNSLLTSITLENNDFSSFGRSDSSRACIYIFNNEILDLTTLTENTISDCGGESPDSPRADFGGLYVNESNKVYLTGNGFLDNTGEYSGAGYLKAGRIICSTNTFSGNRNSTTVDKYAGALTVIAGERLEMALDNFTGNVSNKAGGALYIESASSSSLIDLHFTGITLENNSATIEGGAVKISSRLDSLFISGATINGNFSSTGSGGCFSINSPELNDLTIASCTIGNNYVINTLTGGFLKLYHDPNLIPQYQAISLHDNICTLANPNPNNNYGLIYARVKSFPQLISISGDEVSGYPLDENYLYHLYHFELLTGGPAPSGEEVHLSMTGNEFRENQCPVFYFENDQVTLTAELEENIVQGDNANAYGTFLSISCKEVPSMSFSDEQYSNLVSLTSGGAVSVETVKETGDVSLLNVSSQNCFSVDGNGGHFSFVSNSSDPARSQNLRIISSDLGNPGISGKTDGNGGAVYFITPGRIDTVRILDSQWNKTGTKGNGGALFIQAGEILEADFAGSEFTDISSENGDGAVCLVADNGNINQLTLKPYLGNSTKFTRCTGQLNGGALSVSASKEIGIVTIDSLVSVGCKAVAGNGGHLSLVSNSSNGALNQQLLILRSTFNNQGVPPAITDGGAIYYNTKGNLQDLEVESSSFTAFQANGNGAAIYALATGMDQVQIARSQFSGLSSLDAAGGALYLEAFDGNIADFECLATEFTDCNAELDGGAVYAKASKKTGMISIDSVASLKCYSASGNGGHFAFISGMNGSIGQELIISNTIFDNTGISNVTGGSGGAVYFTTPGDLGQVNIRSNMFINLKADGNAGAVCIIAGEAGEVSLPGSTFSSITSQGTGGAMFLKTTGGNIGNIMLVPEEEVPASFTNCHSVADGGAIYAEASGEIGTVTLDAVEIAKCHASEGNGGQLSLISMGTDQGLAQEVNMTGCLFTNEGANYVTGGNGGILNYIAESDLASFIISGCEFRQAFAVGDGGSIFLQAGRINSLETSESLFNSSESEVYSGGACCIKTNSGLISGNFTSNRFIDCLARDMGGAIFIEDNKYDNSTENLSWSGNIFRVENPDFMPYAGGAVYCKGINAVSFASDSSMSLSSEEMGGFVYLEKVYRSLFDGIYIYNNMSGSGGVIYNMGDEQSAFDQSTRIFNSTFLFNQAELTGGCFYISGIDSVQIGREDQKNTFVANQSVSTLTGSENGGGVLFVNKAGSLDVSNNSFYVNQAGNNGGVGIVSNISSAIRLKENSFLSNHAHAGGAFTFTNSCKDADVAENLFSHNTSDESGGALLFSPSSENEFVIRDNTFFMNNTGKYGGAIASYRPLRITRNLFRENHLLGDPNLDPQGTTIYLSADGPLTVIKNCVFDQNYYGAVPAVASVYYDNIQQALPAFSMANCSFFNFSDEHLSVFNADPDSLFIQNSIFTQRNNILRDDTVIYVNDRVKLLYCNLIYSQVEDSLDHNYSEYVDFNIGDYFYDSTQFGTNQGNPDPSFFDLHLPPAYYPLRNDQGISGGPENPDTSNLFIFEEPAAQPANFAIIQSHDCFDYTFECRGDSVSTFEFFFWFLPDTIMRTETPVLEYPFDPELTGDRTITALGQNLDLTDVYGFGQTEVNLDIIRIESLTIPAFSSNVIPVPEVPFPFTVEADIYHESGNYTWNWEVTASHGIVFNPDPLSGPESSCQVEITKILAEDAAMEIRYSLSACNGLRTAERTINVTFQVTDLWGLPEIVFFPLPEDIIDTTSFFMISFNKIMTKENGTRLENSDLDNYFPVDAAPCQDLRFNKSVTYANAATIVTIRQYNEITQQADTLCNGQYTFNVKASGLYTEFYRLNKADTSKSYTVCCNDIDEAGTPLRAIVYPNPFDDRVFIDFENKGDYILEVSNLQGQLQKRQKFNAVDQASLDLGALPDGIYILGIANIRESERIYLKLNKITH